MYQFPIRAVFTARVWSPLILLVHIFRLSGGDPIDQSILNGIGTTVVTNKYLVAIRFNGEFQCSGALIDSNIVLTAAHCVEKNLNGEHLRVVGGIASRDGEGGVERKVVKVMTSQMFGMNTLDKEVAVLKLDSPLEGENIATIPVSNSKLPSGAVMEAPGWSVTGPSTTVQAVDNEVCYVNLLNIKFLCTGSDGSSACPDSGGPLVYGGEVHGVFSFTSGGCSSNSPNIYTDVYKMRDFIQKFMTMK